MVHVVQFGVGAETEAEAIKAISHALSNQFQWLLICNYGDHVAQLTEIDALLICPGAIICLELKNWRGDIYPVDRREWKRIHPDGRATIEINPLHQSKRAMDLLLGYLSARSPSLRDSFWMSFAVVFTNSRSTLHREEESEGLRARILNITDFEDNLAQHLAYDHRYFAKKSRKCSIQTVTVFLKLLGIGDDDIRIYTERLQNSAEPAPSQMGQRSRTQAHATPPSPRAATTASGTRGLSRNLNSSEHKAGVQKPSSTPAYINVVKSSSARPASTSERPKETVPSEGKLTPIVVVEPYNRVTPSGTGYRPAFLPVRAPASGWRAYSRRVVIFGVSAALVGYGLYRVTTPSIPVLQPGAIDSTPSLQITAPVPGAKPVETAVTQPTPMTPSVPIAQPGVIGSTPSLEITAPASIAKPVETAVTQPTPKSSPQAAVPIQQAQPLPAPAIQAQAIPGFADVIPPPAAKTLPTPPVGVVRGYRPPLGTPFSSPD